MTRSMAAALATGIVLALAAPVTGARATTLRPVTLDAQAAEAEEVFRARVVAVRAERRESGGGSVIVSKVTFEPIKVYKGAPGPAVVLEFLGGRIGDTAVRAEGVPQFVAGEECILFTIRDGGSACPLVGWGLGRRRVHRFADGAAIVESPEATQSRPAVLASGQALRSSNGGAMTLDAFEKLLAEKVAATAGK